MIITHLYSILIFSIKSNIIENNLSNITYKFCHAASEKLQLKIKSVYKSTKVNKICYLQR